jgi:hypothetical protein
MGTNFRHTVALTLLVWYLMMPPTLAKTSWTCSGGFEGRVADVLIGSAKRMDNCTRWSNVADYEAPLSQWSRISAFPTYEQCQAQRGKNLLNQDNPPFPGPPAMQQQCVSIEDLTVDRNLRF